MSLKIRIGTRDSQLALWQATTVQQQLQQLGLDTELVPVKSQGDINLEQPLYEMGITGIFTKTLDLALINNTIDIAVHSLKDVPTQLPKGIIQAAVLERHTSKDLLVYKANFNPDQSMTIATGSLRRKSQWLNLYPKHKIVDLRGNVQTRLTKLKHNEHWNGAIFAKAGLDRLGITPNLLSNYGFEHTSLDSFVPAPAQGAIMIAARCDNQQVIDAIASLNHKLTAMCVGIERRLLNTLEGGCTAPIGALAQVIDNQLQFKACLLSVNGKQRIDINERMPLSNIMIDSGYEFAQNQAQYILDNGGKAIIQEIKKVVDKNNN